MLEMSAFAPKQTGPKHGMANGHFPPLAPFAIRRTAVKIYGYSDQGLPIEEIEPSELAEITLVASPSELRKIVAFLTSAAEGMERLGSDFDHVHLADKQAGFDESPHFVVFNSTAAGDR